MRQVLDVYKENFESCIFGPYQLKFNIYEEVDYTGLYGICIENSLSEEKAYFEELSSVDECNDKIESIITKIKKQEQLLSWNL